MSIPPRIKSVDGYIEEILNFSESPPGYRGVTSDQYQLIPGVGRLQKGARKADALKKERTMFFDFKRHIAASHGILSNLSTAILAQHYGLPTRLLDWTSSPLTALFFACDGGDDSNAAVYMLPHSLKKFKYLEKIYDIILYGEDKETMDRFNDQDTAQEHSTNRISTYERYLNFISENVDSAVVVNPYVNNKRIQSQDSFFTLHVDPFKGLDMEETKKIIIPGELKKKIRQQLTLLGTHEYSIFPDEDGLCKWLKRKHYSEIMG